MAQNIKRVPKGDPSSRGGEFAKHKRSDAGTDIGLNDDPQGLAYAQMVSDAWEQDPEAVESMYMMEFDDRDDAGHVAYAEYLSSVKGDIEQDELLFGEDFRAQDDSEIDDFSPDFAQMSEGELNRHAIDTRELAHSMFMKSFEEDPVKGRESRDVARRLRREADAILPPSASSSYSHEGYPIAEFEPGMIVTPERDRTNREAEKFEVLEHVERDGFSGLRVRSVNTGESFVMAGATPAGFVKWSRRTESALLGDESNSVYDAAMDHAPDSPEYEAYRDEHDSLLEESFVHRVKEYYPDAVEARIGVNSIGGPQVTVVKADGSQQKSSLSAPNSTRFSDWSKWQSMRSSGSVPSFRVDNI